MDSRWDWAREIWTQKFRPLEEAGYRLERVDCDQFWALSDAELRPHFPPEVFINTRALRSESARTGQARLAASRDDHPLRDFCVVRAGDALAAIFCGEQKTDSCYRMGRSHVHPDFRRRGIYRMVVSATIAYTGALGFDTIVSEHAPSNNPVLIAKLRAGFRITSLEIDPMVGHSVCLTYFHHPDHLAAYQFRCGLATLNPRITAQGLGAWPRLVAQVAGSEPDE